MKSKDSDEPLLLELWIVLILYFLLVPLGLTGVLNLP